MTPFYHNVTQQNLQLKTSYKSYFIYYTDRQTYRQLVTTLAQVVSVFKTSRTAEFPDYSSPMLIFTVQLSLAYFFYLLLP